MAVTLPSEGLLQYFISHDMIGSFTTMTHRVGLDGKDGCTAAQDRQAVLLILSIEHGPARNADNADLETLLLEDRSRLDDNWDLRAGRHES